MELLYPNPAILRNRKEKLFRQVTQVQSQLNNRTTGMTVFGVATVTRAMLFTVRLCGSSMPERFLSVDIRHHLLLHGTYGAVQRSDNLHVRCFQQHTHLHYARLCAAKKLLL